MQASTTSVGALPLVYPALLDRNGGCAITQIEPPTDFRSEMPVGMPTVTPAAAVASADAKLALRH